MAVLNEQIPAHLALEDPAAVAGIADRRGVFQRSMLNLLAMCGIIGVDHSMTPWQPSSQPYPVEEGNERHNSRHLTRESPDRWSAVLLGGGLEKGD